MKKINLQLSIGENAFLLLSEFKKEAKRQDWSNEDIDKKLKEAMNGDYDHLCETLEECCE